MSLEVEPDIKIESVPPGQPQRLESANANHRSLPGGNRSSLGFNTSATAWNPIGTGFQSSQSSTFSSVSYAGPSTSDPPPTKISAEPPVAQNITSTRRPSPSSFDSGHTPNHAYYADNQQDESQSLSRSDEPIVEVRGKLKTLRDSGWREDLKQRKLVVLDGKHTNKRGKFLYWSGTVAYVRFKGDQEATALPIDREVAVLAQKKPFNRK